MALQPMVDHNQRELRRHVRLPSYFGRESVTAYLLCFQVFARHRGVLGLAILDSNDIINVCGWSAFTTRQSDYLPFKDR